MFWKKKLNNGISLLHRSKNKRGAFRLHSNQDSIVYIQLDREKYSVIELSAIGTSFVCKKLNSGEKYKAIVHLPSPQSEIDTELEVISTGPDNICRCRFNKISEYDQELIHHFILHTQKSRIKSEKEHKKRQWFKKHRKI